MRRFSNILIVAGLTALGAVQARAQFLDFSQPARATAMGGNLVALPEGSSAMAFNPAGLALQKQFEVDARYEGLYLGLENDNLSTSNLSALSAPTPFGAFGGSWDHLGSNLLSQDLFRLAWGKQLQVGGVVKDVSGGFSLSLMTQRYTLLTPIAGLSVDQLSPTTFSFGGGLLVDLPEGFTLGLSADNINQPNLGVVGVDRVPVLYRWGLAWKLFTQSPVQLTLTGAQTYSNSQLVSSGGAEILFPNVGARIRGGLDPYQGSVGLGYELADFFLDYAYSFSIQGYSTVSNAALPPSHLLELGFRWGSLPAQAAYETFLKKAQDGEVEERWEKANWYYQECLSMAPGDGIATEGKNRTLVKMNEQRADKWYQDGRTAQRENLPADARNDFEMAVQLAPHNADYARALAEAISQQRKLEGEKEVAEAIRKAAELIEKKNTPGAQQVVEAALQKHPHDAALELVQTSLSDQEDVPEETADSKGQPTTQAAKQNAKQATTEADLLMALGQSELARENLEKALKEHPENVVIKKKLIYLERPTPTVSPENAQKAMDLYNQGLQSYLEGHLEDAIAAWEEAAKADPTNTKVQNNLVRAKIEQKMEHP